MLTEAQAKVLRLMADNNLHQHHDVYWENNVPRGELEGLLAGFVSVSLSDLMYSITDAGRAALAAYDTAQALKQHEAHDAGTVDTSMIWDLDLEIHEGWAPSPQSEAMQAEIAVLKHRVAALEGALRPIALAAVHMRQGDSDTFEESAILLIDSKVVHGGVDIRIEGRGITAIYLRYSHLRDAAKVLGE